MFIMVNYTNFHGDKMFEEKERHAYLLVKK